MVTDFASTLVMREASLRDNPLYYDLEILTPSSPAVLMSVAVQDSKKNLKNPTKRSLPI